MATLGQTENAGETEVTVNTRVCKVSEEGFKEAMYVYPSALL